MASLVTLIEIIEVLRPDCQSVGSRRITSLEQEGVEARLRIDQYRNPFPTSVGLDL